MMACKGGTPYDCRAGSASSLNRQHKERPAVENSMMKDSNGDKPSAVNKHADDSAHYAADGDDIEKVVTPARCSKGQH